MVLTNVQKVYSGTSACKNTHHMLPALIVHGGAGLAVPELQAAQRIGCAAAVDRGWRLLARGGSALDAVCEAVAVLEDDPAFNAGVGSCLTAAGTVEMDASVMEGTTLRAGAVATVRTVRHPVRLARAILEDNRHVMLVGAAAEAFAPRAGLDRCRPDDLITPGQRERWRRRQGGTGNGTVGAVAIDAAGHLAAATSTGGVDGKLPGRVGDSALIGAGTYADDRLGAVSATGHGEAIIRVGLAQWVVEALREGWDPLSASRAGMARLAGRVAGGGGLITIDALGRLAHACNTPHMGVGYMRADLAGPVIHAG